MQHTEVRQFIKEANAAGLSPIEKDVFQYYFSRANSQAWNCPDAETAEEIFRSRNGVCEARKSLIKRGWISDDGLFNIKILKTFSVGNPTQDDDVQSEIRLESAILSRKSDSSVGNPTQTGDFSVGNPTPYKDKRNIGIQEKLEEKKSEARARPFSPVSENGFLQTHKNYFPNYDMPIFLQETILKRVRDGTIWRQAVEFWAENDYRPQSVGKLCNKYDELILAKENGNGSSQNTNKPNARGNAKSGAAAQADNPRTDAETLAWLGISP